MTSLDEYYENSKLTEINEKNVEEYQYMEDKREGDEKK
jgi:hypothetical protein